MSRAQSSRDDRDTTCAAPNPTTGEARRVADAVTPILGEAPHRAIGVAIVTSVVLAFT
jgi:hypothetical protein